VKCTFSAPRYPAAISTGHTAESATPVHALEPQFNPRPVFRSSRSIIARQTAPLPSRRHSAFVTTPPAQRSHGILEGDAGMASAHAAFVTRATLRVSGRPHLARADSAPSSAPECARGPPPAPSFQRARSSESSLVRELKPLRHHALDENDIAPFTVASQEGRRSAVPRPRTAWRRRLIAAFHPMNGRIIRNVFACRETKASETHSAASGRIAGFFSRPSFARATLSGIDATALYGTARGIAPAGRDRPPDARCNELISVIAEGRKSSASIGPPPAGESSRTFRGELHHDLLLPSASNSVRSTRTVLLCG